MPRMGGECLETRNVSFLGYRYPGVGLTWYLVRDHSDSTEGVVCPGIQSVGVHYFM